QVEADILDAVAVALEVNVGVRCSGEIQADRPEERRGFDLAQCSERADEGAQEHLGVAAFDHAHGHARSFECSQRLVDLLPGEIYVVRVPGRMDGVDCAHRSAYALAFGGPPAGGGVRAPTSPSRRRLAAVAAAIMRPRRPLA